MGLIITSATLWLDFKKLKISTFIQDACDIWKTIARIVAHIMINP
jgi:hypothetical protein